MSSDREKLQLISDTRNGVLPQPTIGVSDPPLPPVAEVTKVVEQLDFNYNSDGTLNTINMKDKTLLFVWDSQLRLSRVVTRELKR